MVGQVPFRQAPTVLVHCELDAATAARTALAVDLARRTGARLIGVAACAPKRIAGGARLVGPSLTAAKHEVREALRQAAEEFKTRAAEVARANFRCVAKPADVVLAEAAVSADLVIVGPQGSGPDGPLSLDTAELVRATGRPVLIAPEGLDRLDLRRVVVAWKKAREARRALLDCLPWLAMTEQVLILHIIEDPDEQPEDDGLEAVRDWLSSRVARVEAVRRPVRLERDSVADDILDAADSIGAGLVVAGAYSRAPFSERLFGGVTREFLKRGRPARLLSH
jgi:nucleotide-binding universal stress UspA family protein